MPAKIAKLLRYLYDLPSIASHIRRFLPLPITHWLVRLFLYACLFSAVPPVNANPLPPLSFLGIEQGLSNNTVRSIFQDHHGFMWLGTFDGLNRYDGYDCKVYRNTVHDTNSLVHNIILAITEDSLHRIWIGTRQGVSRLDPLFDRFTTIQLANGANHHLRSVVKDVKADNQHNVYIATEGTGLLICPQGANTAQPVPLVKQGALITRYGVKLIRVNAAGEVWALVQNYGLAQYDVSKRQLILVNDQLPGAAWIEVQDDHLLVGNGTAMYTYSPAQRILVKELDYRSTQPEAGSMVSFAIDHQGFCRLGTVQGYVLVWKRGEVRVQHLGSTSYPWSFNTVGLHTLYIDRQSRTWVGTAREGAAIFDPHKGRFQTISHEPGNNNSLVDNVVSAFYEAPDGKLFIGTDGAGISIWDRKTNQFKTLQASLNNPAALSDNSITNIKADHHGYIWIATFRQALNRYDGATGRITHYRLDNTVTHTVDRVAYGMVEDRQGKLWVSTLRQNSVYGALYVLNQSGNKFDLFDASLSDLFTLYEDKQGALWGGNLNQLVKIDRVNKRHQFYAIGHAVRYIYEDSAGRLWLGTEGGGLQLFDRLQQKVTARYTVNEGLCNDVVLTILEDTTHQLWISTFNGLARFDPVKKQFRNYYQADGLQSNQFHYNSALALHTGELAFGGIRGLNVFRSASVTMEHAMPALRLTGLFINNTAVERDTSYIKAVTAAQITSVTVPYSQAVLGFRFTALEYTTPSKIDYAYYLEGWDRGWNYAGHTRTATYTHLAEGSYTFRVKCTNGEGEWNPQEIAIRITVLPPWYRSWWAYALYAALLIGAVYGFMHYKIRQNRMQYDMKLAQLQAREAQLHVQKEKEINEKRQTFFTNVSHEFRTPLTLIIDPVKEMMEAGQTTPPKESLNLVYRNARRLLSLVDQLLLFRKAETESDNLRLTMLNIGELCREVFESFVQQARIRKIDYRLEGVEEEIMVCADCEKVEIILFNLLSNAMKYTPAEGRITLQVKQTATQVALLVSDTGPGIPAGAGDKIFQRFYQAPDKQGHVKAGFGIGLYLARHFAALHKGALTYASEPGQGTRFQLTLLKGTAHLEGLPVYEAAPMPAVYKEESATEASADKGKELHMLVTEMPTILIVDDDSDLRQYLVTVFHKEFNILQSVNGREGVQLAKQYLPDLIISDITMEELGGMELCKQVKENPALSHIPVILLTASTSSDVRLQGVEAGADDYITKPFEKELLKARVVSLLKKRNSLQQYFYNEITLKQNDGKMSVEYREFLEKCIGIVEEHIDDETFSIKTLSLKMGMSRSSLYRKVNSVSGQSIVGFIRFIRLRKAAQLMITTENNVSEIASMTGFNDIKYFRTHFTQLFGMKPSEYIRKFRKPFHNNLQINRNLLKPD